MFNGWFVHDFPGQMPACSLMRCCSNYGAIMFRLKRMGMCGRKGVWVGNSLASFPGFIMAIILMLFVLKQLFKICSNQNIIHDNGTAPFQCLYALSIFFLAKGSRRTQQNSVHYQFFSFD